MIPADRNYSRSHLWVKLNEAQVVIGVTEPLLRNLGEVIFAELPQPQDEMMVDIPFGEIEGMFRIHQLYPPADAVVLEVNSSVEGNVERLAQDPYGEGWLLKIKAHDPEQLKSLMTADAYTAFCAEEFGQKTSDEG